MHPGLSAAASRPCTKSEALRPSPSRPRVPGLRRRRRGTSLGFDFKGQPLEEQRQLFADKTIQPDWLALLEEDTIAAMASAAASLLDAETFSASSSREALGRVLTAYDAKGRILSETEEAGEPLSRLGKHVVERREGSASTVWAANA